MTDDYFMKKPCKHCPYRRDVKPFLTPARGEELACLTTNQYNSFYCHKTTESDDESDEGEMMVVNSSKLCAGFLTMQIEANGDEYCPDGFEPSHGLVYNDEFEMMQAYERHDE